MPEARGCFRKRSRHQIKRLCARRWRCARRSRRRSVRCSTPRWLRRASRTAAHRSAELSEPAGRCQRQGHLQDLAGLRAGQPAGAGRVTEEKLAAIAHLARLRDAAAEALLKTLAMRRGSLQLVAAHELSRLDSEEVLPPLRSMATDAQAAAGARQPALAGLAHVGRPSDAGRLAACCPTPRRNRLGTASAIRSAGAAIAIVQIAAREPSLLRGWTQLGSQRVSGCQLEHPRSRRHR